MKKYRISYLPLFDSDLAEAWHYIAHKLKSPGAADKLVRDTEAAILKRLKNPAGFQPYRSKSVRENLYYRIRVRNFTVWYVLIDDLMEVRRFLYNKRNAEAILD